ncbi:MAG: F0F1 ATP synthase subunit alpha, partial [Spirochaetota bacterium]|nr:F0F1 ATP synthase subunit alpha [Spirochaetota bacterium]
CPMEFADQVLILYAGTHGLIMEIPLERIAEFEKGFLAAFEKRYASMRSEIAEKGALDTALEAKLRAFIDEYKKEFLDVAPPRN